MNLVAEMLLSEPTPALIWAILVVLTVPAVLLLGNPDVLSNPWRAFREFTVKRRRPAPEQPVAEAVDAARFADEMRAAADRAGAAAGRWEQRWEQAERCQAAAWESWLQAETTLRDSLAAAAFGTPWTVRTCDEYAARERFLHRTVAAAAERGDLPEAAVADALAGRNGWDARLHPLEQELVINRAVAAYRRQQYELAAQAERTAWHDVELARRGGASLRQAQAVAAARAAELAHLLPAPRPGRVAAPRRLVTARVA